jgi:hypothetical protein
MICLKNIITVSAALLGVTGAAHSTAQKGNSSVDLVRKPASLDKRFSVSVAIISEASGYYFVTPFQVGNTSLFLEVSTTNADL